MFGVWVDGWLENEFLKKTPSPKLDLSPYLGLSTLEFVNVSKAHLFGGPSLFTGGILLFTGGPLLDGAFRED